MNTNLNNPEAGTNEILKEQACTTISSYLKSIGCESDGHVLEMLFYYILEAEHDEMTRVRGYDSELWKYEELCRHLLALLTDPEISAKLPEFLQRSAGKCLLNMLGFFASISDG